MLFLKKILDIVERQPGALVEGKKNQVELHEFIIKYLIILTSSIVRRPTSS